MEHLEEGDEQHEDDDSERLPQRLQGNVLLLLPAQGFPKNVSAIYCASENQQHYKHLLSTHGMETTCGQSSQI